LKQLQAPSSNMPKTLVLSTCFFDSNHTILLPFLAIQAS
jgi:hypothetical protein